MRKSRMLLNLPDPRPSRAPLDPLPPAIVDAQASLAATSRSASDAADVRVDAALAAAMADTHSPALAALLAVAPSADIHRHLWRRLVALTAVPMPGRDPGELAVTMFALPLIIVAASERSDGEPVTLPGTLADPQALAAILRSHGALAGNQAFALADALVGAEALDAAALPQLYADARTALGHAPLRVGLVPRPLKAGSQESVHLRFLIGTALSAPMARLLALREPGAWAMPLAQALSRALAVPQATALVLPRAPLALADALVEGRRAQRDVSAQLFASNALRRLRAAFGEPTAIISAHLAPDAQDGGELRLSLSSPFSPRDAEGFRCPLLPTERVDDVVAMLVDLLRDCRVNDVRAVAGIQPDRDAATGLTLMFKPETMPGAAAALPPALN